eukprot:TRINITY_DN737_c0_g1_i1.p1 TRINITY_DN737_c0_g1~~TRINITY_DN737_c0_g1_i1.p1  ORF type:complete len:127 (+),score=12.92 TRINITY_DN737_c0_g1_i1:1453-1833(+)
MIYRIHGSQQDMVKELHSAIELFVEKVKFQLKGENKDDKKKTAVSLRRWLKMELPAKQVELHHLPNDTTFEHVKKELYKIKESVVFLPIDKARHDAGVICKVLYKKLLKEELDTYETAPDNILFFF